MIMLGLLATIGTAPMGLFAAFIAICGLALIGMAVIPKDFMEAGADEDSSNGGRATAAEVARDIADDLAAIATAVNEGLNVTTADPTAVSAGALGAFTDPPSATEMGNTRTLVNQLRTTAIENRALLLALKAALNGVTVDTITSADPTAITDAAIGAFTNPPSAGEMAALRSLVNQIRTTAIENRTLAIEIKTDSNAATVGTVPTLKTIKG